MTPTPQRTIRFDDELWWRLREVVDGMPEMTVSRFVRDAVREKMERMLDRYGALDSSRWRSR